MIAPIVILASWLSGLSGTIPAHDLTLCVADSQYTIPSRTPVHVYVAVTGAGYVKIDTLTAYQGDRWSLPKRFMPPVPIGWPMTVGVSVVDFAGNMRACDRPKIWMIRSVASPAFYSPVVPK